MWNDAGLGGMFVAAFLAATPVPFQSEILFVALLSLEVATPFTLIIVASAGNTLGSVVTYIIGRGILHYQDRPWFPVTPTQLTRATGWFHRWGVWVLLVSWAPFGDIVVLMSGVLRTPWWIFVTLVAVAKTGRYIVLAWVIGWVV